MYYLIFDNGGDTFANNLSDLGLVMEAEVIINMKTGLVLKNRHGSVEHNVWKPPWEKQPPKST
jgi:hypothetical protein